MLDGGLWVPPGTLLTHPQLLELDDDRIDEGKRLHTGFTAALHGAAECLGASDLPSMPVMGLNGRKEKLPPNVANQTCLPMPMPVRLRKHIRAKTDSCVAQVEVCVFSISLYFFARRLGCFRKKPFVLEHAVETLAFMLWVSNSKTVDTVASHAERGRSFEGAQALFPLLRSVLPDSICPDLQPKLGTVCTLIRC